MRFIPPEMVIEDDGEGHIACSRVSLSSNLVRAHEEYIIAKDEGEVLNPDQYNAFSHQVRHYLQEVLHLDVEYS